MKIIYTIIRTKRKTLSLQIHQDGLLTVRAPMNISQEYIENFVQSKKDWIEKHQTKMIQIPKRPLLSKESIEFEKEKLKLYLIPRVHEFWKKETLPSISSIKITKSERRWGSCSSKNGLCFSYRLAEYIGSAFLDAIIVHELAHLIEKNHQKKFWNLVYTMMPSYEIAMKHQKIGE